MISTKSNDNSWVMLIDYVQSFVSAAFDEAKMWKLYTNMMRTRKNKSKIESEK
jgi:hypothetical protein